MVSPDMGVMHCTTQCFLWLRLRVLIFNLSPAHADVARAPCKQSWERPAQEESIAAQEKSQTAAPAGQVACAAPDPAQLQSSKALQTKVGLPAASASCLLDAQSRVFAHQC